ncbi:uncharacterized protein DNG_09294 [Cephalotrichum gorgonifer]|uniref:Cytochrome b561 domain-containing protein n=1 Tax=Cephalotrichum gorgonifer TaxID=2041049 RepID=A0AAE8N707_9PEZI|nr:uncharacterized protein DNG_09294 [Cephalotrichum gorgonifer]
MWTKAKRIASAFAGAAVLAGSLFSNPTLAADVVDIGGQSTFVADDKSIAFGFTVEHLQDDDIYFTIRVPTGTSWGAIGLGSEGMKGALVLMIYLNEAGNNVTFSPRTSHGHWEPIHYPDFEYTVLNGTGIYEDNMVFSGHCHTGCQSWPGGYMDVSDNNQRAMYALGPMESFRSDDVAAPIKYHAKHGSFKIDMRRTFGNADSPSLSDDSQNAGTESHGWKGGLVDSMSTVHAVFMVLVFIVMLPTGVILLRFQDSVKWHGVMQAASLVGGLVGFGMGVACSFHYKRSWSFTSAHQIIGIITIAGLIGQFIIGVMHHLKYKRTGSTTKLAPVHVWLGRLIILLGTINAFLGFLFAFNAWRNMILALLLLVSTGVTSYFLLNQLRRNRRLRRRESSPVFGFNSSPPKSPGGSRAEPYADDNPGLGLREYSPSPAQIGLMDVSGGGKSLGPVQTQREFL